MSFTMFLTPLTVRAQNDSTDEAAQENTDLIHAPSGILM